MIDWQKLRRTRSKILRLEKQLEDLYNARRELIKGMVDDGMKQREIGAYWGISNPRITQILKEQK